MVRLGWHTIYGHACFMHDVILSRTHFAVIKKERVQSTTWCQKWDPEKILDPSGETFNALEHTLVPAIVEKHIKFNYFEHSQATWQIDSNHRLWVGPLQGTFTSVSNSSDRNANLFSTDHSTKSKRRKKWHCCCYGLAIKTSKSIIRTHGPAIDPVMAALEAYTKPQSNQILVRYQLWEIDHLRNS